MLEPESAWIQDSDVGSILKLAREVNDYLSTCVSVYKLFYSEANPTIAIAGRYDPEPGYSPENFEIHITECELMLENIRIIFTKYKDGLPGSNLISDYNRDIFNSHLTTISRNLNKLASVFSDIIGNGHSIPTTRMYKLLYGSERWCNLSIKINDVLLLSNLKQS